MTALQKSLESVLLTPNLEAFYQLVVTILVDGVEV